MTTPAIDGAFTIGGGEWNYGQTMTEDLGKSLFMLPDLTPENILTVLRLALERLPLDALKTFQPILGLAEALFTNVGGAVAAIIDNLITKPLMVTLETLGEWLTAILQTLFPWVPWADIPENIENLLQWLSDSLHAIPFFGDFIQGAETFVDALVRNIAFWITHPGDILSAIITTLQGLFAQGGQLIQTVISSLLYWLAHPGTLLTGIIDFLKDVFSHSGELISTVINSIIYWLTHPGEPGGIGYLLIEAFKGLFANGGALVQTVINTLIYWMQNAGQFLSALITAVINWLKTVGIDLTGGLSFVQIIVDNVAKFFGQTGETLWTWAQGIVRIDNLGTLIQGMFASIFSIFPISMINTAEKVNLLNMGLFQSSSTLEAAGGWSWDSSKNRTGASGGSAKLDCVSSSGVRTLYSNQNIRVAAGDRIAASAWVNTSSTFNSYPGIQLVLVTFAGSTTVSEVVLATRSPTVNQWLEMTNETTPYEIPSGITSVQLALRVLAPITSGTIWWDDLSLWKTGLMKQGLVEYLISAWNGLIGGLGVPYGGTASSANTTDPWNWTLQAGANAKGTANNALGAAAAADGKAVEADGKAVAADGKAVAADGKAVAADGKAVAADGKAVAADGKAVGAQSAAEAADGKAVVADILAALAGASNNMIVSPDMEEIAVARYSSGAGSVGGWNWGYSTDIARSGTRSMKLAATGNFGSGSYRYINFTPQKSDGTLLKYPVVAGQVYKYDVEFYVTGSGTTLAVGPGFLQFNRAGQSSGIFSELMFQTVTNPTKNSWQRLTGTYTIPASVNAVVGEPVFAQPIFTVANAITGDTVYIDRFVIWR